MHLVAITRWGSPLQAELPALAKHLGVVAYDLRLKLAGALPVYFTTTADAESALEHQRFLHERGHGVITCDLDQLPGAAAMPLVREFEIAASGLSLRDATGVPIEVPFAEIVALVRVLSVRAEDITTTTTENKLDLGRMALTGGLMMRKKVEKHTQSTSHAREQVLYMVRHGAPVPLVWREHTLRYTGLGDQIKPSAMHNFATLVQLLRERARGAMYDERMLTQKRRTDAAVLANGPGQRRVEESNERENELAVHILCRAHAEGQLVSL